MGRPSPLAAVEELVGCCDIYDLELLDLPRVRGLLIGIGADEIYLARQRDLLNGFVWMGGVVVACSQVARPYLHGLCPFEPIEHHRPADLEIRRLTPHPVWDGVRPGDLTFRKGVAGFYGRGYYPQLPPGATAINGIGPGGLALDFVYPFGTGEILVHGGNDLWGYRDEATTAARMTPQLLRWILDRPGPS
jgi:hypothetical protein